MEDFTIDCVSGKKEDYIQGESNRNYIHLAISEKDELCSVDLDKDKAKELINYLTKFVEQPKPVKGWIVIYSDMSKSRIFDTEREAITYMNNWSEAYVVQIEEVP